VSGGWSRDEMVRRAAAEVKPGRIVNLGIGLPTEVANFIPAGSDVVLHSENGLLGMGPFPYEDEIDPQVVNAGKQLVTQWRTTPKVIDWDGDGLPDLVMLDARGYLSLFRRARHEGKLLLLPPERIFLEPGGRFMNLAAGRAGASGRHSTRSPTR